VTTIISSAEGVQAETNEVSVPDARAAEQTGLVVLRLSESTNDELLIAIQSLKNRLELPDDFLGSVHQIQFFSKCANISLDYPIRLGYQSLTPTHHG
jgi:hypothetical protein